MKNQLILIFVLLSSFVCAQSYPPAAGEEGSTAIPYNDPSFVGWATGIEVWRGFVNIEDTSIEYDGSNLATFGEPEVALGPATDITTDVVSLGDSGIAILTFDKPITNGPGFDFAIFENGLADDFLELAHVEVSSDGVNFVRFPSHSETQTEVQIGTFGSLDPTYLNNLAGKYRVGFGTPFDLEELKDEPNLDVNKITHVKIIDVVGSIGEKGTVDSYGNKINDLFPTPFHSGGFDLNAVGVIHEFNVLDIPEEEKDFFTIYPNPSSGIITIKWSHGDSRELIIIDATGKKIIEENCKGISTYKIELQSGIYFLKSQNIVRKIIVN